MCTRHLLTGHKQLSHSPLSQPTRSLAPSFIFPFSFSRGEHFFIEPSQLLFVLLPLGRAGSPALQAQGKSPALGKGLPLARPATATVSCKGHLVPSRDRARQLPNKTPDHLCCYFFILGFYSPSFYMGESRETLPHVPRQVQHGQLFSLLGQFIPVWEHQTEHCR